MDEKEAIEKAIHEVGNSILSDEPINKRDFSIEDLDVLYSLGYKLYETGDYAQAKLIFHQLVISKPFTLKYWQGLGSTMKMRKEFEGSLTAWSMCALIDSRNPFPHFHASECLFEINQKDEAIKALNEAKTRLQEDQTDLKDQIDHLENLWLKAE